jgi:glyoxylase-like metal-dependent hydrolase (beta-lactamase superfamily II)/ferredoxin
MADPAKRLADNVAGEFFVDATCIDCDNCRQLAPAVFRETGEFSAVYRQPEDSESRRAAWRALVACPTGSIGSTGPNSAREVMEDFPLAVEGPVHYCGFNSAKSFGGNSYFVRHEKGNWLIDSPKFLPQLVRKFEAWGGIDRIFLTHQDDVADADRYAARFGARRIIHRAELSSQPDAEMVIDGEEPIELAPDFLAIPTPGHTAGHCVLLLGKRFLFTGDHLWWNRDRRRLGASRDYCWSSWPRQIESMAKLLEYDFEWVLPGHGQRVRLPPDEMHDHLRQLVERMRVQ